MMNKEVNWWVYIVLASDGKLYTGITTNIERRFSEHSGGKKGAKFFRGNPPLEIVWKKIFPNRSEASKEEARIKALTRPEKERLVGPDSF